MEPAKHESVDHPLERLIFFSDAVFAIAITLLVIEIHVPVLANVGDQAAIDALIHLMPSFFGFALSFLVIARFWTGHHSAFNLTAHYHPSFMWPNLCLLMAIVFMPFATAFMAQNIGARVPTLVYNLTLTLTAVFSLRLIKKATAKPVRRADATEEDVHLLIVRSRSVLFAATLAFLLGLYRPDYSQMALVTIPLWLIVLTWAQRRRMAKANSSII